MKLPTTALFLAAAAVALGGCFSAQQHRAGVQDSETDRMTVGIVQKEIRVGMTSVEVAEALGSPNIVQTDEERREVWIYDKISTDVAYSRSGGAIVGLLFGGSGGGLGGGSADSGASSTSQRTLTVIIKYDSESRVRDFAYHASRF
jgi:outer membrane protein assembly factor BamE (lipoprotein component of BamABCDE complex)